MQPLKGRKVLFGALAVLACSGDPTGNESIPTEIQAPNVVFVTQGDSQPVIAAVLDEDGQILQSDINHANVGAGIEVVEDPAFLQVNTGTPIGRQHRFFVKGVDLVASSFTLQAFDLSKTIQVTTVPGVLNATVSDTVPAIGSPVTVTLPSGVFLTDSSVVTVAGLEQVVQSVDSAAGVIVFLPAPNSDAPLVISNLGVTSDPDLAFTLATAVNIHTDSVTIAPVTVSSTTPAAGAPLTVTRTDPRFSFAAESQVILGIDTAITQSIAPDGSSITVVPNPGTIGPPTIQSIFVGGYPLDLPASAADTITVGAVGVTPIPGTGDPGTAPTIEIIPGITRGVVDAVTAGYAACADVFGVPCQIYEITIPTEGNLGVFATWEGTSDLGIYMLEDDGATFTGGVNCDIHGSGDDAKPETCLHPLPAAGTYFVAVVPFGPAPLPLWVSLRVTGPLPPAQ